MKHADERPEDEFKRLVVQLATTRAEAQAARESRADARSAAVDRPQAWSEGLRQALQRVVAALRFDNSGSAAAGLRGHLAEARHLLFSAKGRDIDLRVPTEQAWALASGRALSLTESQRRVFSGDELRSAFLADHLRPYQGLLRLALHADDLGEPEAAVQVLQRLDSFRARAMADRLQQPQPIGADSALPAGRGQLNWLYRREQRQRVDGESSPALSARIRETERQLLEHSRRQRLQAAGTGPGDAGDGPAAPFDPAELRALLLEGDALVVFGVSGDELFAAVATRQGVRLQRRRPRGRPRSRRCARCASSSTPCAWVRRRWPPACRC